MKIKRGSTSVRRLIFIGDSSSTTGAGLANLTHASSGLVCWYFAADLANDLQITLVSATLGTYTSGGFVAVDNTNMPGWYEIGIPNAVLDGGNEVAIQLRGATNMVPVNIYIELDSVDYQDSAAFGLSRIDAAVSSRLASASYEAPANSDIAAIKAKTDNLPSDPADASDIASAFGTVNTKLDAIDDFIDTEVSSIKAKTDNLPANPAKEESVQAVLGSV